MVKRSLQLLGAVVLAILLSGIVGAGQAMAKPAEPEKMGANVSVTIVPKSAGTSANMLVYDIVAATHDVTFARNTTITVPFNAAALEFKDAQFSGEPAWLQKLEANAIVLKIEQLHKDRPSTTTVRFARLPNAPADARLTERLTYRWSVLGKWESGKSNVPMALQPFYSLDVSTFNTPEGRTVQRFAGNLFNPNEPVSFWCNMPDGSVHGMQIRTGTDTVLEHKVTAGEKRVHSFAEAIRADGDGAMAINFPDAELTPGYYSVVAYGHWSGLQAVGAFQIP